MPQLELTGMTFGRLTVIARAERGACPGPHLAWTCHCACGTVVTVVGPSLRTGLTKSCGCLRREVTGAKRRSHRQSNSREYQSWAHAKRRCFSPRDANYANYGGRGITMCAEWRNSAATFLRDMGPCPTGHTLDRIDNDGNYEPGNCRWATALTQTNNTRTNRRVTFRGETHTVAEWARIIGMPRDTLKCRLHHGWPPERALTTPVRA